MSIEVTVGLDFFRVFLEVSCGIVEFSIADKVARSANFLFQKPSRSLHFRYFSAATVAPS